MPLIWNNEDIGSNYSVDLVEMRKMVEKKSILSVKGGENVRVCDLSNQTWLHKPGIESRATA